MQTTLTLTTLCLFALGARAIEVTSNSACSSTCGGGLTFSTDLTCNDDGYNNTDVGRKMDACLTCESTSTASLPSDGNDTAKNDLYWFLFNMKYTVETCLFNNITDTSGMPACDNACNPLKTVLETSWFTTPMATQYNYCDIDSGSFPANADGCASCLQGKPGSAVLGNFLEAMSAGCSSRPNATLGQTLSLPVSLFDINSGSSSSGSFSSSSSPTSTQSTPSLSSPSSVSTSSADSKISATSTSNSAVVASSTAPSSPSSPTSTSVSSSGLSTAASIGIGVGIGIAALASVSAIFVWCFLRRRRRSENILDGKAELYTNDITQPPTYSQNPASELPSKPINYGGQVSELHSEHSRFPEEMDASGRSPPAELGTYER